MGLSHFHRCANHRIKPITWISFLRNMLRDKRVDSSDGFKPMIPSSRTNHWVKSMSPMRTIPSFERLGENAVKMIDRAKERELTSTLIYFAPRDFPPRGILSAVYHRLAINIPSREGNAARKLCPRSSMHLSKGLDFLPTELKLYTRMV